MSEERERESEDNGSEPIASIEESGTGTVDQPDIVAATARWLVPLVRPAVLVLLAGLGAGLWVSANVDRHWVEQKVTYNVYENEAGRLVYQKAFSKGLAWIPAGPEMTRTFVLVEPASSMLTFPSVTVQLSNR